MLARRNGHGGGQESPLEIGCSLAPVPILINFNEVEIGAALITRRFYICESGLRRVPACALADGIRSLGNGTKLPSAPRAFS